jgi:hypothetical protein
MYEPCQLEDSLGDERTGQERPDVNPELGARRGSTPP